MAKQKWGWSQPTYKQVLGPDPPSRFLPSRNQVVLLILALVGLLQPLSVLCWATFATITFPARVASGRGLRLVNRYRFLFHRFKPSCASESLGEERFRSGLGQGGWILHLFLSSLHFFSGLRFFWCSFGGSNYRNHLDLPQVFWGVAIKLRGLCFTKQWFDVFCPSSKLWRVLCIFPGWMGNTRTFIGLWAEDLTNGLLVVIVSGWAYQLQSVVWTSWLGGSFKCALFSPGKLGKWSNLTNDSYFSNGLVETTN